MTVVRHRFGFGTVFCVTSTTTDSTPAPAVKSEPSRRERVVLELPAWRSEIWVDVPDDSE